MIRFVLLSVSKSFITQSSSWNLLDCSSCFPATSASSSSFCFLLKVFCFPSAGLSLEALWIPSLSTLIAISHFTLYCYLFLELLLSLNMLSYLHVLDQCLLPLILFWHCSKFVLSFEARKMVKWSSYKICTSNLHSVSYFSEVNAQPCLLPGHDWLKINASCSRAWHSFDNRSEVCAGCRSDEYQAVPKEQHGSHPLNWSLWIMLGSTSSPSS